MCGIIGRAGPLKEADERVFKILLLLDYLRGQDSTGVACVSKKGKVDVLKVADDPIILMKQPDFDNTIVGMSDAIWIGHNRAATIGGTTRANAHPFRCDHITGVHNGTLEKSSFLELASRLPEEYGTDSETIFAHMAVYGVEDTISRLEGAWALVWYDEITKTLNMVKNEKRPLYTCVAVREGKQILTWASEYKMIIAARAMADTNDGSLLQDEEGFTFFPLPNDTLHTWSKEDLLEGTVSPKLSPMPGKPPVIKFTVADTQDKKETKDYQSGGFPLVEDKYDVSDLHIEHDSSGLVLGMLEEDEWLEIARYGCACCGKDVSPDEVGLVVYTNEGVVICPTCSGESTTVISNAYGLMIPDRIIG